MGLKAILVHLDNSATSSARLDVAIAYARKHGALLQGLYLVTHTYYDSSDIGEQSTANSIEKIFSEKSAEAGIASEWIYIDWSVVGADFTELISMHACYSDLIIVGQTNPASPSRNIPADFPERLVLTSGRPVLIVPYAGTFETAAERVMVAWKAGRESIRAINDALPCLEKARRVSIVGTGASSDAIEGTFAAIRAHLSRHGVEATTELINAGDLSAADVILNNACEQMIDLLVMGAYSHTRRGTLDLSPIARHILKHLTVPVLMSH